MLAGVELIVTAVPSTNQVLGSRARRTRPATNFSEASRFRAAIATMGEASSSRRVADAALQLRSRLPRARSRVHEGWRAWRSRSGTWRGRPIPVRRSDTSSGARSAASTYPALCARSSSCSARTTARCRTRSSIEVLNPEPAALQDAETSAVKQARHEVCHAGVVASADRVSDAVEKPRSWRVIRPGLAHGEPWVGSFVLQSCMNHSSTGGQGKHSGSLLFLAELSRPRLGRVPTARARGAGRSGRGASCPRTRGGTARGPGAPAPRGPRSRRARPGNTGAGR
jgi:hypothetical protein